MAHSDEHAGPTTKIRQGPSGVVFTYREAVRDVPAAWCITGADGKLIRAVPPRKGDDLWFVVIGEGSSERVYSMEGPDSEERAFAVAEKKYRKAGVV